MCSSDLSRVVRGRKIEARARCGGGVMEVREGAFGCVGTRDGADAAYKDVLAAVPKVPSRTSITSGTGPKRGPVKNATVRA